MTEELKNVFTLVLNEFIKIKATNFDKVKDIFIEYYGEDRVDWEYGSILTLSAGLIPRDIENIIFKLSNDGLLYEECCEDIYTCNNRNLDIHSDIIVNDLQEHFLNLPEEARRDLINNLEDAENSGYITVYFPEVIITNENNASTKIKNLFARVEVSDDGSLVGRFRLLRSHYTYAHFINNYMHSHVSRIPLHENEVGDFQSCCTGSGPINDTMMNLREFSEEQWLQFCWDLDKYVQVESLSGIPYHKLIDCDNEKSCQSPIISFYSRYRAYSEMSFYHAPEYKNFIHYVISSQKIKFTWAHNMWEIAHSYSEFAIIITELFLNWSKEYWLNCTEYKSQYFKSWVSKYLTPVIYTEKGLYTEGTSCNATKIGNFKGKLIITFKGQDFLGEVDDPKGEAAKLHILDPKTIGVIYETLLKTLNIYYGRETSKTSSSEGQI